MPALLAEALGLTEKVRAIPIREPETTHSIGLVVPHRDPLTPSISALFSEGKQLAPLLASSKWDLRDLGKQGEDRDRGRCDEQRLSLPL
jgi:hypothetical protein